MITKEDVYAWLDKQVEAYKVMSEPLSDEIENLTFYSQSNESVHIWNIEKLLEITGDTFVRSYYTSKSDKITFRYRGVEFFGIAKEKRIMKKPA